MIFKISRRKARPEKANQSYENILNDKYTFESNSVAHGSQVYEYRLYSNMKRKEEMCPSLCWNHSHPLGGFCYVMSTLMKNREENPPTAVLVLNSKQCHLPSFSRMSSSNNSRLLELEGTKSILWFYRQ